MIRLAIAGLAATFVLNADWACTHVTVIDPASGRVRPDVTVVVSGERIASVGKAGPPRGARVTDGRGKFLIPGLWDMHVHMRGTWDLGVRDDACRTFFAPQFTKNGVTGVRDLWGSLDDIRRLRAEIASGEAIGPRIVAAGNAVDGPRPALPGAIACANAEQGREAVVRLKRDGADFVKVYSLLPRDVYFAIAEEAGRQGLPFAGHVPNSVTAGEASDAGQKSIEHLQGVFLACSSRKSDGRFGESLRAAAESYDAGKAAALFAKFVKNGTWHTPTLTVLRSAAYFGDAEYMKDDRIELLPEIIRRFWRAGGMGMDASEDPAGRRRQFERELRLVGAMHRAGVKILAGTDTPNPYVFPGTSLHDELALLVKAGLTPMEALAAATIRPAEYLGMTDSLGSIAAGKFADLVLLPANPLDDIGNTRRIEAVVLNGRVQTYQSPGTSR